MLSAGLHARFYEYAVGSSDTCVFLNGLNADGLETGFLLRLGFEGQPVLMLQALRDLLKKRLERDRRPQSNHVRFAARFVCELRQEILSPAGSPNAMPVVTNARSVDRVNDNSGLLGVGDGAINVWVVGREAAAEALDAAADHDDFTPFGGRLRPVLDSFG